MKTKSAYQQTLDGVLYTASKNCGFLDSQDVSVIAGSDRLRQLLVRCGGCRFICAAQDVAHILACIVAGGDYVRDVSLLASDPVMTNAREVRERADEKAARIVINKPSALREALAHTAALNSPIASTPGHFNESDCGGVFDGNSVTSDADPGL